MSEELLTFKILLLGYTGVGKASYIRRFIGDTFQDNSLTTIGLDTKIKFIKFKEKKIQLIICDSTGQERFKVLPKNISKGADGIIFLYAVDNKQSFSGIKGWINDIKEAIDIKKVELLIVGTKSDLPLEEREVDI